MKGVGLVLGSRRVEVKQPRGPKKLSGEGEGHCVGSDAHKNRPWGAKSQERTEGGREQNGPGGLQGKLLSLFFILHARSANAIKSRSAWHLTDSAPWGNTGISA